MQPILELHNADEDRDAYGADGDADADDGNASWEKQPSRWRRLKAMVVIQT